MTNPQPSFNCTEFVYRWQDGREEVRYRRTYNSEDALKLIAEVENLQKINLDSPYFYRHTFNPCY